MKAQFRIFKASFKTWQTLLDEATEFATSVGKERLITISQSADQGQGVVVVWYWA